MIRRRHNTPVKSLACRARLVLYDSFRASTLTEIGAFRRFRTTWKSGKQLCSCNWQHSGLGLGFEGCRALFLKLEGSSVEELGGGEVWRFLTDGLGCSLEALGLYPEGLSRQP